MGPMGWDGTNCQSHGMGWDEIFFWKSHGIGRDESFGPMGRFFRPIPSHPMGPMGRKEYKKTFKDLNQFP